MVLPRAASVDVDEDVLQLELRLDLANEGHEIGRHPPVAVLEELKEIFSFYKSLNRNYKL